MEMTPPTALSNSGGEEVEASLYQFCMLALDFSTFIAYIKLLPSNKHPDKTSFERWKLNLRCSATLSVTNLFLT